MKKKADEKYIALNQRGWEQAAPVHRRAKFDDLKNAFQNQSFIYLNRIAYYLFRKIGVVGKSILHPMCNNGRELLSLKRLGAKRCVGVDFSEEFINQGKELARHTGLACEFIIGDILSLPGSLEGEFDIVFISSGSLRWIPDINKLFDIITSLLAGRGSLLVTEMHPVLNIYDSNQQNCGGTGGSFSYFHNKPFKHDKGLNYWEDQPYDSPPVYYFQHTLGDILSQCLSHGLRIRHFNEYPLDLSGGRYSRFKDIKLPLSFSLVAQREGRL